MRVIMTLTKKGLIERVKKNVYLKGERRPRQQFLFPEYNRTHLTSFQATDLVNSFLEIIKSNLAKGEPIQVAGFGKFAIKHKWARKGRNPQTGESIIIKPKKVVVFRSSSKLKDKINR